MRTATVLGVLVLTTLAGATAMASEWVSLGKAGEGQESTVDVSSIRLGDGVRRASFKEVLAPRAVRGGGNSWVMFVRRRVAFNCEEQSMREESVTAYYNDGDTRTLAPQELRGAWLPARPDSFDAVEMQFVCAWTPR